MYDNGVSRCQMKFKFPRTIITDYYDTVENTIYVVTGGGNLICHSFKNEAFKFFQVTTTQIQNDSIIAICGWWKTVIKMSHVLSKNPIVRNLPPMPITEDIRYSFTLVNFQNKLIILAGGKDA